MENKKKPLLASTKTCTGCLACIDACNFNALDVKMRTDGHLYPEVKLENCTQCGLCTKTCPVVSGFSYQSENDTSKPYAAWSNNDELRIKSASGGVFAAIAVNTIKKGGYVAGATMDGLKTKHILINKIEDIRKLQGSKYQQSNSAGIYKATYKKLKNNKTVLFSGLPCQIAGLLSFLNGKKYDGKLYTADMICGGVPSSLLINKFENKYPEVDKIISFRNKNNGWTSTNYKYELEYQNKDQTLKNSKKNLIINGFSGTLTNRYSCYDCPYTHHNRKADITLADFWGLKEYPEEHFKGVSLVIVHSKNGQDLLNKADITKHATTWQKSVPHNPRLVYGKRPFARYKLARIFMPLLFEKLKYNTLLKIYAGNIVKKDILWWPLKISKYITYRISQRIKGKYINNYLENKINEN